MMLGIIKRNFISRNCFVTLYKSLVRSHLDFANSVWYPKRNTDVDKLEQVKTRNARQSLAYSPLGAVVSPTSEYL